MTTEKTTPLLESIDASLKRLVEVANMRRQPAPPRKAEPLKDPCFGCGRFKSCKKTEMSCLDKFNYIQSRH